MIRSEDIISELSRKRLYNYQAENGLNHMSEILKVMGNPHEQLKCINIVGTHGKGSTAHTIREVLVTSGYKVGLCTSPHLVSVTERIQVNNTQISETRLFELIEHILSVCKLHGLHEPTFPMLITLAAILLFKERKVDAAIFETDIGGRLDPVNVITPVATIITTVGFEHAKQLGGTLEQIARHKLGAIKKGVPVISCIEQPTLLPLLYLNVVKHDAPCFVLNDNMHYAITGRDIKGRYIVDFYGKGLDQRYTGVVMNMLGEHQVKNTLMAIKALECLVPHGFVITSLAITMACSQLVCTGRLEYIDHNIIIDSSNNVEGIMALLTVLDKQLHHLKIKILTTPFEDKYFKMLLEGLAARSRHLYLTQSYKNPLVPDSALTDLVDDLDLWHISCIEDMYLAAEIALGELKESEVLIVTGSMKFAGSMKAFLATKLQEK